MTREPEAVPADRWHDDNPDRTKTHPASSPANHEAPLMDGPTGRAPLSSELVGDPGAEGDRKGEGGAMGGAIAGTAIAGPVGGVVGGVIGATIGSAAEVDTGAEADTEHDASELHEANE
jgi:hypothetical protein